jgi:hypothetical protein
MWRFLLGALVVFLYYNQVKIRRGYYIVTQLVETTSKTVIPSIKVDVKVKEPTLDQLQELGFKVKK